MLSPGRREVQQHVPGRISKQVTIEEPRPQLALADDSPDQPRVGQWRSRCADQALVPVWRVRRVRCVGAFESKQGIAALAPAPGGAFESLKPLSDLADLLGQAQQDQPICLGQFPQSQVGDLAEDPPQRNDPLSPARVNQDLGVRLVETGKYIVERRHRGRYD